MNVSVLGEIVNPAGGGLGEGDTSRVDIMLQLPVLLLRPEDATGAHGAVHISALLPGPSQPELLSFPWRGLTVLLVLVEELKAPVSPCHASPGMAGAATTPL